MITLYAGDLSDEELYTKIDILSEWEPSLIEELCKRAGLSEELQEADKIGDGEWLNVAKEAAETLGFDGSIFY